jgi:RNA polymerase primary sigma factor
MLEPTASRTDHRNLTRYLDEAGHYDLFDADTERERAREVCEARREWGLAVLSLPSVLEDVLSLLFPTPEEPGAAVVAVREALAALRAEPTPERAADLRTATDALVVHLHRVDPGNTGFLRVGDAVRTWRHRSSSVLATSLDAARRTDAQRWAARVSETQARYVALRNRFLCSNLRLVVTLARRYGRTRMPLPDRVQEGNLGLIKAIERFDPERNIRFSTYAAWWIRHAVMRAVVDRGRVVRVPAHLHAVASKLRRARPELQEQLGREPTLPELATYVGVPTAKAKLALSALEFHTVAMSEPVSGSNVTLAEVLADERRAEDPDRVDDSFDAPLALDALDALDGVSRHIVRRRFGLEGEEVATLQELGHEFGLSRERIRQLQNRALSALHDLVESGEVTSIGLASAAA